MSVLGNKTLKFSNFSDLKARIFSSIILLVLAVIFYNAPLYISASIILFAFSIMFIEWHRTSIGKKSFLDFCVLVYMILGTLGFMVLNFLRYNSLENLEILIMYVIFGTVVTDSSAYFIGRIMGGIKPFPQLSPNKTLSGYLGGLLIGGSVPLLINSVFSSSDLDYKKIIYLYLIGGFISVGVLAGDLLESVFKRKNNVKDTGTILPGHGGLLDRFDGLLGASLVIFLEMMIFI